MRDRAATPMKSGSQKSDKRVRLKALEGQAAPRKNIGRVTRLLKLVALLQAGRGGNIEQLSEAYQVCRRTAYRDIQALRQAGFPITYDDRRDRYFVSPTSYMPSANLTAEEAMSLVALAAETGRNATLPGFPFIRSAALKLENTLPAGLKEISQGIRQAVQMELGPEMLDRDGYATFEAIHGARTRGQVLRIEYDMGFGTEPLVTRLRVYALYRCKQSWYVIGRSSAHWDVTTFNMRQILSITPTSESYEVPTNFGVEKYLRNAWSVTPGAGPDHEILIRFQPDVAQEVEQYRWHKTQVTERQGDGSVIFRATVSGLNEISRWILGFGDQAEVLSPEILRKVIFEKAGAMVATYERSIRSLSAS